MSTRPAPRGADRADDCKNRVGFETAPDAAGNRFPEMAASAGGTRATLAFQGPNRQFATRATQFLWSITSHTEPFLAPQVKDGLRG
jgi:hypothetical protein